MNAVVRHISPASVRKAFRDFGRDMVDVGKEELIGHLTASDIDQLAPAILSKASSRFLDAALSLRLRTIEAKPLINALARAERLGYEPDDIVEEAPSNGQERVIPQHQLAFAPPTNARPGRKEAAPTAAVPAAVPAAAPGPQPQPQPQAVQSPQPKWQCHVCNRLFQYEDAYLYVCTRPFSWLCRSLDVLIWPSAYAERDLQTSAPQAAYWVQVYLRILRAGLQHDTWQAICEDSPVCKLIQRRQLTRPFLSAAQNEQGVWRLSCGAGDAGEAGDAWEKTAVCGIDSSQDVSFAGCGS